MRLGRRFNERGFLHDDGVCFPRSRLPGGRYGARIGSGPPEAREVFEEVDDALGLKLSSIMWEGPAETLTLTENAQPALWRSRLRSARAIEKGGFGTSDKVAFVAGHSLGEYSA